MKCPLIEVFGMDKLILMVKGHEIWLEKTMVKGDDVEIGLYFGHVMKMDG